METGPHNLGPDLFQMRNWIVISKCFSNRRHLYSLESLFCCGVRAVFEAGPSLLTFFPSFFAFWIFPKTILAWCAQTARENSDPSEVRQKPGRVCCHIRAWSFYAQDKWVLLGSKLWKKSSDAHNPSWLEVIFLLSTQQTIWQKVDILMGNKSRWLERGWTGRKTISFLRAWFRCLNKLPQHAHFLLSFFLMLLTPNMNQCEFQSHKIIFTCENLPVYRNEIDSEDFV